MRRWIVRLILLVVLPLLSLAPEVSAQQGKPRQRNRIQTPARDSTDSAAVLRGGRLRRPVGPGSGLQGPAHIKPYAQQCGGDLNPCKPQPYLNVPLPAILATDQTGIQFVGTIQNQAIDPTAWGHVDSLTCVVSSPQMSCVVIVPPPAYIYPLETKNFTLSITTKGMGPFTLTIRTVLSNAGGSANSTQTSKVDVRGSSFIVFSEPDGGAGTVPQGDTLRASVDSLHELFPATVRTWVDGVEKTASTSVGTAKIKLATTPLNLTRGDHTWRVYACVDGGRCDDITATFYYDIPQPSPDSSQVAANAGPFPVEDQTPSVLGTLGGGWLLGALPLPPTDLRGCPKAVGDPEIRVTTPVSYTRQFGTTIWINGVPFVYPDGMIFRAEEMIEAPIRITTLTMDHTTSETTKTCANWTFLTPGQFFYDVGASDVNEPRWRSYPYGDRNFTGSGPGRAPITPGGTSGPTPVVTAPAATGPQFLPSAGAIDTNSYQVTLNGGVIWPAVNDVSGAPSNLKLYKEAMATIGATFRLPVGHPYLNVGGWNELIISVGDQSGNRTAVRSRFLVNGSLANADVTARTVGRDLTRRSMGECAAFGAVQCDETFITQVIPGFVSRDKDRSLHLVYRSGSQRQRLTLPVRIQYAEFATRPDSIWTFASVAGSQTGPTLRFAGTKGTPGGAGAWPLAASGREDRMIGAELNAGTGGLVSRRVTTTVREFTSGVTSDQLLSQDVIQIHLDDTTATRFGTGWQLAEYSRLLSTTVNGVTARVWALGDGSFLTFTRPGTTWVSPGGVSAKLWEIVGDSIPFRLTPPDGSVLAFYNDGRPAWVQDQFQNRTRFVHTGAQLTSIIDPDTTKYVFAYDANNRVIKVQIVPKGGIAHDVMALVYDAGGRQTQSILFRKDTLGTGIGISGDTTKYTYTTSSAGAFLASVTTPARAPLYTPVTTDFTYDTLGWVPKMIKRPLFRGVRDSSFYRSAWRLSVPQSYQGRKTGLAPYAPVRTEYYRGAMMDVSGRITEFKADPFGNPTWVRRVAPIGNVLLPDGSTGASQGDELRLITRDSYGRVTEILAGLGTTARRDRVRMHYSASYQLVDSIWRTSRAYPTPAAPDTLDLETFTFDSVSLGTAGGLGAGSDGRCYRTLTSKDALGNVAASVQYMSSGRQLCLPWKVTGYGASNVTTFAYNGGTIAGARPTSVTDPVGLTTTVTYDPATWNTASVAVPATGTSTISYNAFGAPIGSTGGDGMVTTIARDYSGRDSVSRAGLGTVTRKFYGRDGLVDSVAIYAGVAGEGNLGTTGTPQVTRNYYNVLGAVDSTVGPGRLPGQSGSTTAGRVQRVHYTRDVQPDTTWSGNGAFVAAVYDWAGRPITSIQSPVTTATTAFADDSIRTLYNFNAGVQAGIHLSPGQRTETWYDGRGEVKKVKTTDNRLGRVSEHRVAYTLSGAIAVDSTVLADSVSLIRRFTYDRLGRRLAVGDTLRAAAGSAVTGDTAGRQTYTYDAVSQLLVVDSGFGAGSTTPYGVVTWAYDIGGRETSRSVQLTNGVNRLTTRTGYTTTGLVDSILTTWDLNATVGPQWYKFKQQGYNASGDLISYSERINTGAQVDSASTDLTYTPDHLRRLQQSVRNTVGGWSQYNWNYDPFDNRLSQLATASSGGSACAFSDTTTFGADNRLLRSGPPQAYVSSTCPLVHRYYYDNSGNRIMAVDTSVASGGPSWQRSVMTYTAAGQLYFSITPAPSPYTWPTYGASWTWYDGSGLRAVSKEGTMNGVYPLPDTTMTGPWTWYIYDGGQLSLTATRAGNTWNIGGRQLAGGIDRPMVMRTGAGPVALVADRQGTFQTALSTTGAWDQSFTVTAANLFGARDGATRGTGGATGGTGFSGAGVSSSGAGFVYLRNRWYDPQTGRFLTQDPIGLGGGVNLYAYAGNNPSMFSDPFGLCAEGDGGSDTTRYQSRYNHLDESCVTRGQKVEAGDTIGYSGNSGDLTTGPHLHFEFRQITAEKGDALANKESTPINPLNCFASGFCGAPLTSKLSINLPGGNFGNRVNPVTGNAEMHPGLDMHAPMRSPVIATHAGTVVWSGTIKGGGLSIYINH